MMPVIKLLIQQPSFRRKKIIGKPANEHYKIQDTTRLAFVSRKCAKAVRHPVKTIPSTKRVSSGQLSQLE
jgi:hypothetical protein